jgi:hypothetical protein
VSLSVDSSFGVSFLQSLFSLLVWLVMVLQIVDPFCVNDHEGWVVGCPEIGL